MLKALSVKQPWAFLLALGIKDVENRVWPTAFRGELLIHASKSIDPHAEVALCLNEHPVTGAPDCLPKDIYNAFRNGSRGGTAYGGIIAIVEIVDCVTASSSPWFTGPYGFVVRNARVLPFTPLRGQQRFFNVAVPVRGLDQ